MMMIFYFCPDSQVKSAGIRRLYEHVNCLHNHGFHAAVLHSKSDFHRDDLPIVPKAFLDKAGSIKANDFIVIPEGFPGLLSDLKDIPIRKIVICLSWSYVFTGLPEKISWRDYKVERIIGDSPFTTEMIAWVMGLPAHVITPEISEKLYPFSPLKLKKMKIVYITRKCPQVALLKKILYLKNSAFIDDFTWMGLDGLDEDSYAEHVREAAIFLNMSQAEGLAHACFEAWHSGALLCGYSSIGGQRVFVGGGDQQNSLIAETGDYLTLAWLMEPLLDDLLKGEFSHWEKIQLRGHSIAMTMNRENFQNELIAFWQRFAPHEKPISD